MLNYIADFMCKELMLIIEVDGITHQDERVMKNDKIRQRRLEEYGFTVLRFTNNEVLRQMEGVKMFLENWIDNFEKNSGNCPPP